MKLPSVLHVMLGVGTTMAFAPQQLQPLPLCHNSGCNSRSLVLTHNVVAPLAASIDTSVVATLASVAIAATAMYFNSPETSDEIRSMFDLDATEVKGTTKTLGAVAPKAKLELEIPKLTKGTSPQELTTMVKDVADKMEQQSRALQDKIERAKADETEIVETVVATPKNNKPAKISRVYTENESYPKQWSPVAPLKKKRRFVVRLFKKIVMPWKKWQSL